MRETVHKVHRTIILACGDRKNGHIIIAYKLLRYINEMRTVQRGNSKVSEFTFSQIYESLHDSTWSQQFNSNFGITQMPVPGSHDSNLVHFRSAFNTGMQKASSKMSALSKFVKAIRNLHSVIFLYCERDVASFSIFMLTQYC